jgi:hypothetical protein
MVNARQIRAVVTGQTLFPFTEYFSSAKSLDPARIHDFHLNTATRKYR